MASKENPRRRAAQQRRKLAAAFASLPTNPVPSDSVEGNGTGGHDATHPGYRIPRVGTYSSAIEHAVYDRDTNSWVRDPRWDGPVPA